MAKNGDRNIEELVNEGERELQDFFPTQSAEIDMVTAFKMSRIRQAVYFGKVSKRHHQSTRRDVCYGGSITLPSYVITNPIELQAETGEKYQWVYKTPSDSPVARRRVFVERAQFIALDIDETLVWLNASKGSPRHDEMRRSLEQEAEEIPNQVILQLMYGRVEDKKSLLPNANNILKR